MDKSWKKLLSEPWFEEEDRSDNPTFMFVKNHGNGFCSVTDGYKCCDKFVFAEAEAGAGADVAALKPTDFILVTDFIQNGNTYHVLKWEFLMSMRQCSIVFAVSGASYYLLRNNN